ncbi:hypothetical protein GO003_025050 [Methylicorpusculum oleiharenae]|jgi:hypothetical protein|uniref:hypothetical protein n=1 Tax=Methylicorpusculum oleiharenae TaxID=1338687 RepID=UPI00135A0DCA|nr:hypothetical protein [Methylicorpusculum oleiharenae]MBS3951464.1 hypothetical protein [Methylomicrobium sp.]MCD2453650.1 hypothetical protein [Methylicorpusculum oleiharenae]
MSRYVFNAYQLDTTPGNLSSPFSPSLDWTGDDNAYLLWLRERFRSSPEVRERLGLAHRANRRADQELDIVGPYRQVLRYAIDNYGKAKQVSL